MEKDLTEEHSAHQSLLKESHRASKDEMNGHMVEAPSTQDLPVLLKLQRRVKELEQDKQLLWQQLSRTEEAQQQKAKVEELRAELDVERLKRQEVESENRKLKQDLNALQEFLSNESSEMTPSAPASLPYNMKLQQLRSSNKELLERIEEVRPLRAPMARQEGLQDNDSVLREGVKSELDVPSFDDAERSVNAHRLTKEGELWLAYEGFKETNRLLKHQMQEWEHTQNEKYDMLLEEVHKLKIEKEHQQKLLAQSPLLSEEAHAEALLEQQENKDNLFHKLKKLKTYVKKDFEASSQPKNAACVMNAPLRAPNNTCREKEYFGMLGYREGDESRLLKNLVTDLKPRGLEVSFPPGLPAYIIFMCVRYADSVNNDQRVSALLNSTISSIKGVIKRRGHHFEVVSFWLANTCILMHCLKQYSGDEAVMKHNSAKQNEQSLANFELSEYQQLLGDLAVQIYRQLIKCMEEFLQPIIVASMLEPESTQGALRLKPKGLRKLSISSPEEAPVTIEVLLQRLGLFHTTMTQHGVDSDLIKQAFRQQYYIICAVTLNHLLQRKNTCSWSQGLQIRYNVWQLKEWLNERALADCGAKETLDPLFQVTHLLQLDKRTEADARTICSTCTALTTAQIVKVLTLYAPVIEFEERVSPTFITTIKNLLKDRIEPSTLQMDTKKIFSVTLGFTPSTVALETIQIPASLNLSFLTHI